MHALIIYESMFGNVQAIATAIAAGLGTAQPGIEIDLVEVSKAPLQLPESCQLLVLGTPTHAFGMPRPESRVEAGKKTDQPLVSTGIGVREWIATVAIPHGLHMTTFDTQISHGALIKKLDHAAASASKKLRKRGATMITPPNHFFVHDTTGPLLDGEVERATEWGMVLRTFID